MAKIDIDKFICRIYEELKSISDSRHPEGCEDARLSIVRQAIEEQGLRITDDFQLEEISGNNGGISSNSEWSKEDERMLNNTIGAVFAADYYTYDDKLKIEDWLEELKKRITNN